MHSGYKDIDIALSSPKLTGHKVTQTTSAVVDTGIVPPPSMWRRIRRDVVLLGAGNVGIILAQLAFRSILITVLVPTAYGRLSLVLSIYNTVWIIGASGLPNSIARYIAVIAPEDDSAIIRSGVRAGVWPTVIAAAAVAIISGILLKSPFAFIFAAIGLSSLVYTLLTMGILRGRGRVSAAASIMPIAAVGEFAPLVVLWLSGFHITLLSAFGVFCLGNVIGLVAGILCTMRTAPNRTNRAELAAEKNLTPVPSSRQLLGFSMWLGAATVGVAVLPLVIRLAAALDSYTIVAIIDVALVLLAIPQRIGTVIVFAVVPHAARALDKGDLNLAVSRRENLMLIVPFVLMAFIVGFTPIVGWIFDVLGRPVYAKSAQYLALALLAGPPRILYGLVEGVLIAHGEGRFLAVTALSITAGTSAIIFVLTALGSTVAGFAVFVAAFWAIYLVGAMRIDRVTSAQ